MEAIITSSIVAGFALIGTIISAKYVSNIRVVKVEMQLNQLEKRVFEHNRLIDRMYKVEERIKVIESKGESHG